MQTFFYGVFFKNRDVFIKKKHHKGVLFIIGGEIVLIKV